jgi:quaternary ammonium compound-resistance protein SugE
MEMLFAVLGGLLLGIGVYYLLPGKGSYGVAVLPAAAGAATAVVWASLTWAGWKFDGGWIWVVALAAGVAASALTGVVLARVRAASDERMFQTLSKA